MSKRSTEKEAKSFHSKKKPDIENHDGKIFPEKRYFSLRYIIIDNFIRWRHVLRKKYGTVVYEEVAYGLCNFLERAVFTRRILTLLESNISSNLNCIFTIILPKIFRRLSDAKNYFTKSKCYKRAVIPKII